MRLWLAGPGVPATAVAMILADRGIALSSEELAVFTHAPTELPYLNVHRFLAGLGVAIPALYGDAAERGVLLLEDIGDCALWDAVQQQSDARVLELYRAAIDQLLLIQVVGTRRADASCIAFQQAFDERLFLWEFEHFIEYGIERRVATPIPAADLDVMRHHFGAIARRLGAEPRYLNHRDYHSWNLYVQDGAVRVIDFQDALLAPAPYDLATLLGDRDTPHVIRPDLEAQLLALLPRALGCDGGGAARPGGLRGGVLPVRAAKGAEGGRAFLFSRYREKEARISSLYSIDGATDPANSSAFPSARGVGRHPASVFARGVDVRAMILAAGKGTRLRPLTDSVPKPLVDVAGRPMIGFPLRLVREAGIHDVVINLHHLGHMIRDRLGDGAACGLRIQYSDEDPILDTGGGIAAARQWLNGDSFALLNADTYMDLRLDDVVAVHRRTGALATMVVRPDPEARRRDAAYVDASGRLWSLLGAERARGAGRPRRM